MIKGFDQETQPLNDYEMGVLLPLLVRGLRTKIGRENGRCSSHSWNRMMISSLLLVILLAVPLMVSHGKKWD